MEGQILALWRREKGNLKKIERRRSNSTNGLVGYDTTLTRLGPRVRLPLGVMVLIFSLKLVFYLFKIYIYVELNLKYFQKSNILLHVPNNL